MANGTKGDDPILDIIHFKISRFSPTADALIAEIVELGAQRELESAVNLFAPPSIAALEVELKEMRDRLLADRKERGWEV
ncbi:MAG: hypothetical protein WBQ85_08780 [Candidatus Sulfotelmatobacter sp.]